MLGGKQREPELVRGEPLGIKRAVANHEARSSARRRDPRKPADLSNCPSAGWNTERNTIGTTDPTRAAADRR